MYTLLLIGNLFATPLLFAYIVTNLFNPMPHEWWETFINLFWVSYMLRLGAKYV